MTKMEWREASRPHDALLQMGGDRAMLTNRAVHHYACGSLLGSTCGLRYGHKVIMKRAANQEPYLDRQWCVKRAHVHQCQCTVPASCKAHSKLSTCLHAKHGDRSSGGREHWSSPVRAIDKDLAVCFDTAILATLT